MAYNGLAMGLLVYIGGFVGGYLEFWAACWSNDCVQLIRCIGIIQISQFCLGVYHPHSVSSGQLHV